MQTPFEAFVEAIWAAQREVAAAHNMAGVHALVSREQREQLDSVLATLDSLKQGLFAGGGATSERAR